MAAGLLGVTACAQERQDLALEADRSAPAVEADDAVADTEPSTPTEPRAMQVLWTVEGHFATRPVAAGDSVDDVLVALMAEGGSLSVLAVDPSTGAELWRRPSTASQVTPGVAFPLLHEDGLVFHLAPGSGGEAAVEAVDAVTGEVAWVSAESPGGFSDPLRPCGSPPDLTLCITAGGDSSTTRWQLDPATGEQVGPAGLRRSGLVPPPGSGSRSEPVQVDGEERRALGGDLYDMLDSGDIARIVDGQVLWQRSPSELFDGRPVSPDYGWSVRERDELLVVWFGVETDIGDGTHELAVQHTAGVDATTGDTRWVREGAVGACGRLNYLLLPMLDRGWLRCRGTGTITVDNQEVVGAELDSVVIESFTPESGDAEWSLDLGAASALWDEQQPLVRMDHQSFALTRDDGTNVGVDLFAGETVDVGAAEIGWCWSLNEYDYAGADPGFRLGQPFAAPCSLSEPHLPAPEQPDEDVGVSVDDVFVWMDHDGLHGARHPD